MDADLVIVHTTGAQIKLSNAEQESLRRFCEHGGTALLNCFSNWTRNDGHGGEAVAFLGIRPWPLSRFLKERFSRLHQDLGSVSPCADLCLAGPWGNHELYPAWHSVQVARDSGVHAADALVIPDTLRMSRDGNVHGERQHHEVPVTAASMAGDIAAADRMAARRPHGSFGNCGESEFDARRPLETGAAIRLCEPTASESSDYCQGPLWFPEACNAGQAMVCSNMHWLADPGFWNGGLFRHMPNTTLWLNLCAASCRSL